MTDNVVSSGPLAGLRVVELAGLGPAPFATMLMAELGAEVIRIDRPGGAGVINGFETVDFLNRGKKSVLLDMKKAGAREAALALIDTADVLIEGYRPGVAEKLGLGPQDCMSRNKKLVYGRMTGWGQTGPLAQSAGHDIDYIAIVGALHAIGDKQSPTIPLNLVGDFGGGAMYLIIGVLAALRESDRSGQGQVVDAAIVDGAAHLMTAIHTLTATGGWGPERESNMLDGGAPYYGVYETSDGQHMAVGAIEGKFYAELIQLLNIDVAPTDQHKKSTWNGTKKAISQAFAAKSQAEWTEIFGSSDACVAPILETQQAVSHPHVVARKTLFERDGHVQAAPAPRFSRSSPGLPSAPPRPGQHTEEILGAVLHHDLAGLLESGAATQLEEEFNRS